MLPPLGKAVIAWAMLTATLSGKTGTAPGTTTITIPPGAGPPVLVGGLGGYYQMGRYNRHGSVRQNPGVLVRNAYGDLKGAGLGVVLPTDFDMAPMRGYLPYMTGWIPGTVTYQPDVLGQAPEVALVAMQARKLAAEAEHAEERTRSERVGRIWMVVGGLVGVGGLLVSVIALTRAGRRG
jgi:hypothetical protein